MIKEATQINNKKIEEFNKNCYNKNVGIMGGTFNPIHLGHLYISQYIKENLNLDKIIFIPAGNPPHKKSFVSSKQRYEMVLLSIKDNNDFLAFDFEIKKKSYSYTFETLEFLNENYKNVNFNFIVGADSICEIETWNNFTRNFELANFIASTRKGKYEEFYEEKIKTLNEKYNNKIIKINPPSIEISSTNIRDNIKNNKSIKYEVDKEVEKYIIENNIYN